MNIVGGLDPVDGGDVRVVERCQHARFTFEARKVSRVSGKCRWNDLDGDVSCEHGIARTIDLTHAANADPLEYPVDADPLSRRERRSGGAHQCCGDTHSPAIKWAEARDLLRQEAL